jgi:hypothetical protein
MADLNGCWYLVPMLGGQCNWVKNVTAAGGAATIRHGHSAHSQLVEVPVAERAAVLRRYLQKVPGGRPHIPCGPRASAAELEAIAERYPVFAWCRLTRALAERLPYAHGGRVGTHGS